MGRGGGHSSGGRSFSHSSGRSFGGRSSSSHRGGSSSGSHRSSSSSYRPSTTVRHYHYGGGYRSYGGGYSSGRIGLWITLAAALIILVVVCAIVSSSGNVGRSTVERTAIQPAAPFSRDCIDDRADWIMDRNVLLNGMESFYKATGVQPAICIANDLDGSTDKSGAEAFASARYDELVGHEKGILVLFVEWYPNDWDCWYMAGEAAQTVMDSEACDILMDYVEAYYTSDMSEDEYFGKVFSDTGIRIMSVTPTVATYVPAMICAAVAVAVIFAAVKLAKMKHKRDREQAEETQQILNTPIDRL